MEAVVDIGLLDTTIQSHLVADAPAITWVPAPSLSLPVSLSPSY